MRAELQAYPHFGQRSHVGGQADPTFPAPGLGDHGLFLYQTPKAWYGAYALHDIGAGLELPTGLTPTAIIYAPTLMPSGGSCIEVPMAHYRDANGASRHEVWAWDWCAGALYNGQLGNVWDLTNAGFQADYVRTYQGKSTIAISVVTPNTGRTQGQCWYMMLYNYSIGGWVQFFQSCGASLTGYGTMGWSFWESWWVLGPSFCPTFPSVRALELSVADPSTNDWASITTYPTSYSNTLDNGQYCWNGGGYTFSFPPTGLSANTWRANTPNP